MDLQIACLWNLFMAKMGTEDVASCIIFSRILVLTLPFEDKISSICPIEGRFALLHQEKLSKKWCS